MVSEGRGSEDNPAKKFANEEEEARTVSNKIDYARMAGRAAMGPKQAAFFVFATRCGRGFGGPDWKKRLAAHAVSGNSSGGRAEFLRSGEGWRDFLWLILGKTL